MARYTVVIEQWDGEFFAYVPGVSGTSVGQTPILALDYVKEAIHMVLEYLSEQGM